MKTIKAPAKINLYLSIRGIRSDGYHLLDTLFQTVELCDSLSWTAQPDRQQCLLNGKLTARGAKSLLPFDASNIILKAARAFAEAFHVDVSGSFNLIKRIPVQAGLGGGSSDAAAAIQLLSSCYLKKPTPAQKKTLHKIAVRLGADVPFFLHGGLARARGIGDKLQPYPYFPSFWAVIVKPRIGLSTPEVYRWYDQDLKKGRITLTPPPKIASIVRCVRASSFVEDISSFLYNDFEPVVFHRIPELKKLKMQLLNWGAPVALMSGSGSAFWAICRDRAEALKLAHKAKQSKDDVWVVRSLGAQ